MSKFVEQPLILVVEDRDEDLFMVKRAFSQLGFDTPVQYVRDGEQALAYLSGKGPFANRSEYPLPNVMLLDLKMPRKNGFEVLAWVKQQSSLKDLRTVVLTTSEDIYEVNRAYQLGAASFLTKPLNFTEFKDMVVAMYNYWVALNRPPTIERARNLPPVNPYQQSSATQE